MFSAQHSRSRWALASTLLVVTAWVRLAAAQTSPVVCDSSWNWAYNNLVQSPCLVAAYLHQRCTDRTWNVPPLLDGQFYTPPSEVEANQCQCSSVTYSLMAACAQCQGQVSVPWSRWRTNCTDDLVSIGSYPFEIPRGTSVPAWAFLDVTRSDQFDENAARGILDRAESAGLPASTTTTSSGSSSASAPAASESVEESDTTTEVSSGGGNQNLPAIIGGTVGGVVGLGLIVLLFLYLRKRDQKKSKVAPSAQFVKNLGTAGTPLPAGFDPASVGFKTPSRHNSPQSGSGLNDVRNHGHNGSGNTFQPMAGAAFAVGNNNRSDPFGYSVPPTAGSDDERGLFAWSPPPPTATPMRTTSPPYVGSSNHGHGGAGYTSFAYEPQPSPEPMFAYNHPSGASMSSTTPMVQAQGHTSPIPYQTSSLYSQSTMISGNAGHPYNPYVSSGTQSPPHVQGYPPQGRQGYAPHQQQGGRWSGGDPIPEM